MMLWLLIVSSLSGPLAYMTFATKAECVSMGDGIAQDVQDTIKVPRVFSCKEIVNFPHKEGKTP